MFPALESQLITLLICLIMIETSSTWRKLTYIHLLEARYVHELRIKKLRTLYITPDKSEPLKESASPKTRIDDIKEVETETAAPSQLPGQIK